MTLENQYFQEELVSLGYKLQRAFQSMTPDDLNAFLFEHPHYPNDGYVIGKFRIFQTSFPSFLCALDDHHTRKFVPMILKFNKYLDRKRAMNEKMNLLVEAWFDETFGRLPQEDPMYFADWCRRIQPMYFQTDQNGWQEDSPAVQEFSAKTDGKRRKLWFDKYHQRYLTAYLTAHRRDDITLKTDRQSTASSWKQITKAMLARTIASKHFK